MRNADHLHCYEGGGLSANIRGDQVLVGSAAFMNLMEVSLPVGLNVKNAVFCAIDGELAGIFALSYTLPDTVFPSIEELMREKVGPVLATRDFNLIPAMLKQRFKLAADKMDFPPVERRRELSDPTRATATSWWPCCAGRASIPWPSPSPAHAVCGGPRWWGRCCAAWAPPWACSWPPTWSPPRLTAPCPH